MSLDYYKYYQKSVAEGKVPGSKSKSSEVNTQRGYAYESRR